MSTIRFSYLIYFFVSISCATIPLFSAVLSQEEVSHILSDKDAKHVYCGEENSNIIQVANRLREIDTDHNSLLHQFFSHIEAGFRLAEYRSVVDMLEHAAEVLANNPQVDEDLQNELGHVIDQVISDTLTVQTLDDKDDLHKRVIALPASLEIFNLDETIDPLFSKKLVAKSPALVVGTANTTLSGLSTIDGVSLSTSDRVLLVNQTNQIENGLWEAQSGSWTRPADFASTTAADQAYVLISSGSVNAGSSWLCTTPTAVIDTDPITFVLFAYPDIILGANVGSGTGLVFRDKTGTTLNFKSLIAGTDIIVTNNADDITIDTDATSSNTANTIIRRDATGRFSAGIASLTDAVISNSVTISPFGTAGVVHNNASGVISSSLIVNADVASGAAIADSKLATLTTAGKVSNSATTANSANLANAIVSRDASGNFGAATITASLNGNATSATTATTAGTATDFTGSLTGDVTGTQSATVVSYVGGQAAVLVANGTALANAAISSNTANAIVRRNASGNFSAGAISITDAVLTTSLRVTPLNTVGVVHNNAAGLFSTSLIVNADIAAGAGIVDTKLATISTAGKVANTATTATALNVPSTIVSRDSSGNINANFVIASLLGYATDNVLRAGDTMTGTLQLPAGTAALPSLRFTGSTTAGLSTTAGNLLFSTNALERMRISSGGAVSIKAFTSPGVVKNDALGNLSSSLIVDSNIASGAGIVDSKLATISTPGKINNSATTATHLSNANTIVGRDNLANFAGNQIEAVNFVATGNIILSTEPSSSAAAGNILKGESPFIHDYGTDNTFVGINAGNFSMSGNGKNTMVGSNAFGSNVSGENNTGLGYGSLAMCTTGTNNIAIGSFSGLTIVTGSNNIYINADATSSSEASTTRIGTSQTKCFVAGIRGITTGNANAVAVLVDSAGQLGTISSSQKVKHDIEDMSDESDNILNLRPVTFVYNGDERKTKQYGLIAEEVEEIFPSIVATDEKGQPETVQYHVLPVLLLNEMKKQHATIDQMKNIISDLQAQLTEFIERVKTLENPNKE